MADDQAVNNYLAMSGFYGPNPYSQFQNQALPLPSYAGTPTDAMGRPIAGTTLNTPPPAAATPPPSGATDYSTSNPAYANWLKGHPPGSVMGGGGQVTGGQAGAQGGANQGLQGGMNVQPTMMPGLYGQSQSAPAAPATSSQAPGTMDFLQARAMLANPGPVATPGANGPSPVQQPNVLANFLANNQGGRGAGNYSNQGFFNTLNALKSGTQPGSGAL